jgi:hypothetical protein
MGFCAFCKVAVDPNIEQCSKCGNLRFRFLTGRRHRKVTPPGRVLGWPDTSGRAIPSLGFVWSEDAEMTEPPQDPKDLAIRLEEDELVLPARPSLTFKGRGWMEYIDTRTEETWWEQFDSLEWRIRQLKNF